MSKIIFIAIIAIVVQGKDTFVQAQTYMPYRFCETEGVEVFTGVWFDSSGTYCTEDHRTPDGDKYGHAHIPHHFLFIAFPPGHSPKIVTEEKSDWAWRQYYVGFTEESGSTFSKNCFAYCTGAPTVMFHEGWTAFTNGSSTCDSSSGAKSYGDSSHVISITAIETYPEDFCAIKSTSEKNASGGVYSSTFALPGGRGTGGNPVRRNK